MTIIRGVATSRGIAATSAAVLTFLLLVTVIPAVTFLPSAAVVATGGEHGPPTSTVAPLPEYTTSQVVTISYAVFCLKKKIFRFGCGPGCNRKTHVQDPTAG